MWESRRPPLFLREIVPVTVSLFLYYYLFPLSSYLLPLPSSIYHLPSYRWLGCCLSTGGTPPFTLPRQHPRHFCEWSDVLGGVNKFHYEKIKVAFCGLQSNALQVVRPYLTGGKALLCRLQSRLLLQVPIYKGLRRVLSAENGEIVCKDISYVLFCLWKYTYTLIHLVFYKPLRTYVCL